MLLPADEWVIRSARWSMSVRVSRRGLVTVSAGLVLVVVLLGASLFIGDYPMSPDALTRTLVGHAPDRLTEFFVWGKRFPRAAVAAGVGAALGIAGALFQLLTRNPLASPDIIGVSSGASVGAVCVLLVWGGSVGQAAWGAAGGAVLCALLLVLGNLRSGLNGVRLVLTGIGVSVMALACIDYVLSRVYVASAVTAQTWLVGSLQGASWSSAHALAAALLLTLPLLAWCAPAMRHLRLGDETAQAAGVPVRRFRIILLLTATLLVAAAVAAAGPISFVALIAPHLASSLRGRASVPVAALCGSVLVMSSDLVAQFALPLPIPVGAVTVTLGGAAFVWLLWREGSRSLPA